MNIQISDFHLLSSFNDYSKYSDQPPCFLFEKRVLEIKAGEYLNALKQFSFPAVPFYAIKSNCFQKILNTLVKMGFGLDASSRRELEIAKVAKAKKIIYTGPGKTPEDLDYAINESAEITMHLDSFHELNSLKQIAPSKNVNICVRINTKNHGGWKKFGISLQELKKFYLLSKKIKNVHFKGIHFHNSWNSSSEPYIQTLKELDEYLNKNFSKRELDDFQILDIGGGFLCNKIDGYFTEKEEQNKDFFTHLKGYYLDEAQEINSLFFDIQAFLQKSIFRSFKNLQIFTEPGRRLCSHCFHILLKVIDIKNNDLIILDGGTENFGFSVNNKYYFPLYNLTHPAKTESKVIMAGSLCSIDDIWGYYCYSEKFCVGDIVLIPFQGAYTYSFSKNFIRPFPNVYSV